MSKHLKTDARLVGLIVFTSLLLVYVAGNINPMEWDIGLRILAATWFIIASVAVILHD
jgi:hypothetical protein